MGAPSSGGDGGGSSQGVLDALDDITDKMRNEFEYWYPFDLRASGKDLIRNHLTNIS